MDFNEKLAESAAKREQEPPSSPLPLDIAEDLAVEEHLVKVETTAHVTKQIIEVTIDDSTPTPDSDDMRIDVPKENRQMEIKVEMEDAEMDVVSQYSAE